jgi:hypothetical protein
LTISFVHHVLTGPAPKFPNSLDRQQKADAMFWSALSREQNGASFTPVERRLLFVLTLMFAEQMVLRF